MYLKLKHTICKPCNKIAYETEMLANNALRLCQSNGREEESVYRCELNPRAWHLSRWPKTKHYTPVGEFIEYGDKGATITASRKAGGMVGVAISYQNSMGTRSYSVANLTREEATRLHDLLTLSLFDNSEE